MLIAFALVIAGCLSGSTPPHAAVSSAPGMGTHPGQVSVYPQPGARTASPQTQLSIRGITPKKIGTVRVVGSASGAHAGTLRADSDGEGASLYFANPFTPGETVTVATGLPVTGARSGTYRFTVSRPVSDAAGPGVESGGNEDVQGFSSAPSLKPPTLSVQAGTLSAADGDLFLAPKDGPGQDGPMIVAPDGQLVWFDPLPDQSRAYDFREQTYQGRPVLTWWQGYNAANGHGRGEGVIYDDSYQRVATVKAANGYGSDLHDFTLTGEDTALVTAYQPVHWDTSSVGGSTKGVVLDCILQEIDIPTGNVLDEWHALDHVSLADSYAVAPSGSEPDDYFHINSLDKSADGNLLISARATHTVYEVDAATGDVVWQLGGKHSSFTGTGNDFSSQHDAKWLGADQISLFDNASGVGKATAKHSNGIVIGLDPSAHTATIEHSYTTASVPLADSQGDIQLLPDGDVLVGWGAQPYVTEFDADGRVVFQAKLPAKDQTYRAFRFAWSGHPLTRPAAVATRHGDEASVDVSWNGATEVSSWRALAGPSPSRLTAVSTRSDAGFQTTIPLAGSPAYVQVQALDQAGKVLATSAPTAITG